ncbi:MAG: methylenetetrahydrofolate reductase [Pseudomonadota bacterium]
MIVQKLKTSLGYTQDQKIIDVIETEKFTISAEMIPPRNGEPMPMTMGKLKKVVESGVDFLSVTKGAGGSLRGGSLPIAQTIKDHFEKPCIAHFTCRDLSPQDVENQLVDHHYFGVRNILALRGDPPMGQENWIPHKDGYSYAYELIEQIRNLNSGQFIPRQGFKTESREPTDFCIGAAIYPEHPDPSERLEFAKIKFEKGAEYGITQMIFDPEPFGVLSEQLRQHSCHQPILPGLRILRSKKQADVMETRFGCSVPDWYRSQLPDTHEKGETDPGVIKPFVELVDRLKDKGAPGIHIFVLADIDLCRLAMKDLKEKFQ